MANIRDVAKRANVGVGTVSRVLNKNGYVGEETRKRIEQAVKELNYKPNELARNLFRNRTGIIGVVVPDLEHPFFAKFTKEVEMELYKHGYKTMACNTIEISNREKEYLDMLDRNIVDGIIMGSHSLNDSEYLQTKRPIVSLDHDFGNKIPMISSDHEKGGRLAAKKMIDDGCHNVIQFAGALNVKTPANNRHSEFEKVMKANGKNVITIQTEWNMFSYSYYYKTMEEYMDKYPDVDGIFTADIPALCCLNIAKRKGIRVPEDLKIIGYDAVDITKMSFPVLTAVKQDIKALARSCVETIINLINKSGNIEYRQIIDVSLQDGGTTL